MQIFVFWILKNFDIFEKYVDAIRNYGGKKKIVIYKYILNWINAYHIIYKSENVFWIT